MGTTLYPIEFMKLFKPLLVLSKEKDPVVGMTLGAKSSFFFIYMDGKLSKSQSHELA